MRTKHLGLTIGSGPEVVKTKRRGYDARMPKECPMCSEFMRLVTRETVTRVPGTSQEVKTTAREWVCPECDYFEEAEAGDEPGS
jgi:C4-type Zn-finger protein